MAGQQGAARVHPARLGVLRTSSDVLALLEAIDRHEAAGKRAVYARAQEVYLGVKKASKLPPLFRGVDKEVAARRQRRRWLAVGAGMEQVCALVSAAQRGWVADFGDPNTRRGTTRKSGIDTTK
jgi:hypothetical protein